MNKLLHHSWGKETRRSPAPFPPGRSASRSSQKHILQNQQLISTRPAALYQLTTRMHSRALPCWTGCRVRDECRSSPHGSQLKLYSKASPLWLAAESILVQAQHGPAFSSAGKIAKVVELYSTSEKQGRKLANRIATWMLSRVKFGLKVSELNVLPSEGKKEKLISRGEFKMATTMFWSKGWDTCHAFR